MKQSLAQKNW